MKPILEAWVKEHPLVQRWLETKASEKTRFGYSQQLRAFCEETKITPEQLAKMDTRDIIHLILVYRAKEKKNGTPQNTILSTITPVRAFCKSVGKYLQFEKRELGKVVSDVTSHNFSNADLKALFEIGSIKEKTILAVSASLGWEISALLDLSYSKIKQGIDRAVANKESFVYFDSIRQKTGEMRLGILNTLAIQWLQKYFETVPQPENDKLFDYSQHGINLMLNRLVREANIKVDGRVHFHRIRAWTMISLVKAGFSEFETKIILGKAIPVSDATYLQGLKAVVMEKYPERYHSTLDFTNGNNAEIKKTVYALEKENRDLKEELQRMKDRATSTDADNASNKSKIEELFKMIEDIKSSTGLNTQEILQIRKQRQQAKEKQQDKRVT